MTIAPEPPGYVERFVSALYQKIFRLLSAEESLEIQLIQKIRSKSLPPRDLILQFERMVSPEEKRQIYEQLGKAKDLPSKDRMLNWMWRNDAEVSRCYRDFGKEAARRNPYLLAKSFEAILLNK
jgi:hypothetical protein